ncbi:response regulator transcription factor [Caldicellulosiruptoraceae bacterium PP1]
MRLLVIEDQINLLKTISRRLQEVGYAVDIAQDGEEGLNYILDIQYDLIILDIMIPKIDGLSLLKLIRERGIHIPVLFLTAKDTIEDRVKGLDAGADDYLVKPFSFDELLARIRALLRRQNNNRETVIKIMDLVIDLNTRTVMRSGKLIELTSKEYAVLEYLAKNKGRVLTRSQIAEHIWNYDFEGSSNIVDVYIRYLRRKIDDEFDNKLIQTVRGTGYIIRGEK